jgi:hypothetical protein
MEHLRKLCISCNQPNSRPRSPYCSKVCGMRLLRATREAQRICLMCPKPAQQGIKHCARHRMYINSRASNRNIDGKCAFCGARLHRRRTLRCGRCTKNQLLYRRNLRNGRVVEGLCEVCEAPTEGGKRKCRSCQSWKNTYEKRRRALYLAKGLCTRCGGSRCPQYRFCDACREYYRNHYREKST